MARKRRSPIRIMRRAWEFIMSPMGKVRKPITTIISISNRRRDWKVFLFNKSLRSFRLLKRRKRRYIGAYEYEYEFSPSSNPLFDWDRKRQFKKRTMFSCCLCGGGGGGGGDVVNDDEVAFGDVPSENVLDVDEEETEGLEVVEWGEEEEEESVDRRAEVFIERFYKEMKLQRQDSVVQYMEMMNRSC